MFFQTGLVWFNHQLESTTVDASEIPNNHLGCIKTWNKIMGETWIHTTYNGLDCSINWMFFCFTFFSNGLFVPQLFQGEEQARQPQLRLTVGIRGSQRVGPCWIPTGGFQGANINKSFWSNYSDLKRPHPKWWFSKGNPLISGKPRLVKYYNLARSLDR